MHSAEHFSAFMASLVLLGYGLIFLGTLLYVCSTGKLRVDIIPPKIN